MERVRRLTVAAALTVVALGGGYALVATREAGPPVPRLGEAAGATVSPSCRTTRGEPAQGTAPGASSAQSRVRLGPGMDLQPSPSAIAAGRRGQRLLVSGTVRAADCITPLQGALVHVWQTNSDGEYGPGHGTQHLRCCYLQGTAQTDAHGRYQIDTVMPGHYKGAAPPPPAHIHFDIRHPTELDFTGDPFLDPSEPAIEVVPVTRIAGSNPPTLRARFDIVLSS
jgi:protocatechuate 3,4-dioxygenase beta subunit